MDELPQVIGNDWSKLIAEGNPPHQGFEAQYSWLRSNGKYSSRLHEIEERIVAYFNRLEMPIRPTIYDYIVLGLRAKEA